MKKYTKISTISIVSVLCAVMVSPVLGASTVRALGGAGTYNSAASASASKAGSSAVRAGTMRVSAAKKRVSAPTAPATTSGTRVSGSAATTAAPSAGAAGNRLSIGKYLGGTKVTGVSGGVSDEDFAGVRDEFATQLDELQAQHDADFAELQGRVDEMADAKQDKLTAGDFIVAEDLENNIVAVDSEALIGEVKTNLTEIEAQIATKAAQTDLDSAKTTLEATDEQLKGRLDALEKNSATLTGSLADYAKIVDVNAKNAEQDASITKNANDIKANAASIDANTQLITTNKTNIETNAASIVTNATNITANTNAISAMDAAYKQADADNLAAANKYTDDEIAKLSSGLDGAAGDVTALAARVTTAEGEIDTLQTEMDAVEAKAAANETAIATNTQNIATNTQGVADNKSAIEALQGKTNDLKALAYKDTVANADVADDAAIDPNKLALPATGEHVLYVNNGAAEWASVVSTYNAPTAPTQN